MLTKTMEQYLTQNRGFLLQFLTQLFQLTWFVEAKNKGKNLIKKRKKSLWELEFKRQVELYLLGIK